MANTGIKRATAVFLTHSTGTDIDGTGSSDLATAGSLISDIESMDMLVTTELQLKLHPDSSGSLSGTGATIEILRDVQGTPQDSVYDNVFAYTIDQSLFVLDEPFRVSISLDAMEYNQFYVKTWNNCGVDIALTYKQVKGDVPVASA